jgi:hypothetical protein
MNAKKVIILILVLLFFASIAIQFINQVSLQTNLKNLLTDMTLDFHTMKDEPFKKRLIFQARRLQLELAPSDIVIERKEGSDYVTISIHYTTNFYILFIPIQRNLVVSVEKSKFKI